MPSRCNWKEKFIFIILFFPWKRVFFFFQNICPVFMLFCIINMVQNEVIYFRHVSFDEYFESCEVNCQLLTHANMPEKLSSRNGLSLSSTSLIHVRVLISYIRWKYTQKQDEKSLWSARFYIIISCTTEEMHAKSMKNIKS